MQEDTHRTIVNLLSSHDPADLQPRAGSGPGGSPAGRSSGLRAAVRTILPLFYIDPLDHPEHVPVIEEAIMVVAGLGEAVIRP